MESEVEDTGGKQPPGWQRARRSNVFTRLVMLVTVLAGQFVVWFRKFLSFRVWECSLLVCFCFLLLYNKLPQKLVASKNDCVVMSYNSVGQESEKGTERILLAAPCGACWSWAIQDSFFTYLSGTSIRVNQMAGVPQVFVS